MLVFYLFIFYFCLFNFPLNMKSLLCNFDGGNICDNNHTASEQLFELNLNLISNSDQQI